MARIDHDGAFKMLLTDFFAEFLELFAPALAAQIDPDDLTFLATESFVELIDPDRRDADMVIQTRLRNRRATILIHLEHQAQPDPTLARRMFRYFARFHDRYDLPIYPIALCSYPSSRSDTPAVYTVTVEPLDVLTFNFQVVQLAKLRWRDFLESENPVAVALMARMQIASRDRWRVKAACLRRAMGLRLTSEARRRIAQFVDLYLPLNAAGEAAFRADVATYTHAEQEGIMEIVTSWQRQGRVEEARDIAFRLATKKFGSLDSVSSVQIEALTKPQLDALLIALLDFTSPDDLAIWLAQRPGESDTEMG